MKCILHCKSVNYLVQHTINLGMVSFLGDMLMITGILYKIGIAIKSSQKINEKDVNFTLFHLIDTCGTYCKHLITLIKQTMYKL